MIQILINNIPIQFGHYPSPEIKINSIEIITPPPQFHIEVSKVEAKYIADYLWNLTQNTDEGVNIIFNRTIMTKNDVNKCKGIWDGIYFRGLT